ncbi:hypothetical protein [Tranquillimonas alkanivorans]|uniref:Uncharacterized protein n=1 Tax=Tranquillimonas alkanivorans TaxID=441119 RepID=A0A1I5V2Y6_9RHOB|nr:hypothetical protein [Tranquillimonas alkanivorans]SFQ01316.1 hypothetical protein SAMN04488047_12615 [Tranquillimonas alkanivorans]
MTGSAAAIPSPGIGAYPGGSASSLPFTRSDTSHSPYRASPLQPFLSNAGEVVGIGDLALLLGLEGDADAKAVCRAFGRFTLFDAELEIQETPICRQRTETWEVRVIRHRPRCRLALRRDARGEWLHDASAVPADVLEFLCAKEGRDGQIVTHRPWKSWRKMSWARGRGRRRRARSGEFSAIVEIEGVRRPTGHVASQIIVSPTSRRAAGPIVIPLPCPTSRIAEAVLSIRRACEEALAAA